MCCSRKICHLASCSLQHPYIHRTRSVRILLDLIERTKEAVRKSDRQEASRIQKLIMFTPRDVSGNHVSSMLQYDERGQPIMADAVSIEDVSTPWMRNIVIVYYYDYTALCSAMFPCSVIYTYMRKALSANAGRLPGFIRDVCMCALCSIVAAMIGY